MSDPGLTNPWEPRQRLIDAVGPHYRSLLFEARDWAKTAQTELDQDELDSIASEARAVAGTLDEEGARLTVSLTDDRERHSRRAHELRSVADRLARKARWTPALRRRRQARLEAAEHRARAQKHERLAAQAQEGLRELGHADRHPYPWFERHLDVLGRGLAAELALDAARQAACHVLGAPGIASLTAACIIPDRGIDVGQLERLVDGSGDARQRVLLDVARELSEREERVSLGELLAELDGEDLDRVLQAIALVKRRPLTLDSSPDDLWIRAAAPEDVECEE